MEHRSLKAIFHLRWRQLLHIAVDPLPTIEGALHLLLLHVVLRRGLDKYLSKQQVLSPPKINLITPLIVAAAFGGGGEGVEHGCEVRDWDDFDGAV